MDDGMIPERQLGQVISVSHASIASRGRSKPFGALDASLEGSGNRSARSIIAGKRKVEVEACVSGWGGSVELLSA